MDKCGHMCGVRYSQINPHRTLKQVREFEETLSKHSGISSPTFVENNSPLKNNPEKKIN